MALSTAQLRVSYAPACSGTNKNFLDAYEALNACFKKWNYAVGPGSGAYNCRTITGGTGYSLHAFPHFTSFTFWNGYRILAIALAVDINPSRNPYGKTLITDMPRGMIDDILAIRTNVGDRVFGWGGYYQTNKDAMHFEIVCPRVSLSSGINPKTVPAHFTPIPAPEPEPAPPEKEEDDMPRPLIFRLSPKHNDVLYMSSARTVHWIKSSASLAGYKFDMQNNGLNPDVCVLSADPSGGYFHDLYNFALNLPFYGEWPPLQAGVVSTRLAWTGPWFKDDPKPTS